MSQSKRKQYISTLEEKKYNVTEAMNFIQASPKVKFNESIDVAIRLESSAPKQGVMISESTYELVKDHILVGDRQEIEVKGKDEKVAAYVLEGLK